MSSKIEYSNRILVAPLNWGLGHATRCMPIINELLKQNIEVIIASDGAALDLLRKEYPQLIFLKLPAYNISYKTSNMIWNIAKQTPRIINAVFREFFVLQRIIKKYQIDAVITDNRFGCWTWKVPTIFMTHQVNIKIPNSGLQFLVNQLNYLILRLFHTVWIPDVPNEPNLAGDLAHHFNIKNAKYIGVLSRMKPLKVEKHYDIGVILSGPEPQRTYLEQQLFKQIQAYSEKNPTLKFLFVKGKMNIDEQREEKNIEIYGYLTAQQLNQKMAACDLIIARSGYSTIMDLAAMQQKAILIPTPGQTEQEYLAEILQIKNICFSQSQSEFDLATAISKSQIYQGFQTNFGKSPLLKKRIVELLQFLSE